MRQSKKGDTKATAPFLKSRNSVHVAYDPARGTTVNFDPAILDKSDAEMLAWLWAWWLSYNAGEKGLRATDVIPEIEEKIRVATLGIDTDFLNVLWLEKALKAYASGNPARAAMLFRAGMRSGAEAKALLDEAMTGRRKQRERARRPREDPLTKLIRLALQASPSMTEVDLIRAIKKQEGRGVIEEVTDEVIFVVSRNGHPAKEVRLTAIKDRISRIRKKLSSR